jgi:hypothetical protein
MDAFVPPSPRDNSYSSNPSYVPSEVLITQNLSTIIRLLDTDSAATPAQTNNKFHHVCRDSHGEAVLAYQRQQSQTIQTPVTGPVSTLTSLSNTASTTISDAGSPSSDDDTAGSVHTGLTTPDEGEWILKITPELVRRLALLPQLKKGFALENLPAELQLEIFSHLDKIDSVCLGLASPLIYPIYRAIHGTKMPLTTRRIGPNSLESAWEVVGKQQCKQCGLYRCELHQHIKTWMPKVMEYCAFKQNFGLAAAKDANATCYRGKPSKPKRCGRHPLRTTSVHQDDELANLLTMTRMTQ